MELSFSYNTPIGSMTHSARIQTSENVNAVKPEEEEKDVEEKEPDSLSECMKEAGESITECAEEIKETVKEAVKESVEKAAEKVDDIGKEFTEE